MQTNVNRPDSDMNGSAGPRIDLWLVLDVLAKRWLWLGMGAVLGALAALFLGAKLVGPKFTASAQLLRYETTGASDLFKQDVPMSPETFGGLIQAPELLRRVGAMVHPAIPPEILAKQLKVDPDDASDLVSVALADRSPEQAVELLNIYLTNAVRVSS